MLVPERSEFCPRLLFARWQYTAQLEARNLEVEKANCLKSEFLASMSHELRTPLHTVIGFTKLLEEESEGPLNPKQKRFLGHILNEFQQVPRVLDQQPTSHKWLEWTWLCVIIVTAVPCNSVPS